VYTPVESQYPMVRHYQKERKLPIRGQRAKYSRHPSFSMVGILTTESQVLGAIDRTWISRNGDSSLIVGVAKAQTTHITRFRVTTSLEASEDAAVAQMMAWQTEHHTVPEHGQRQRKPDWIPRQTLPCRRRTRFGP
jgi:hypothetical protein